MERTKETLEARVRETPLVDRLKECRQRIGNMCAELRGPKMSIPVEYYDDDFYICTTLADAQATVEALQAEKLMLERGVSAQSALIDGLQSQLIQRTAALEAVQHERDEANSHVKFLGATKQANGSFCLDMKKYHARHRCGRHRDDPWKGIDTEIDCFVCLKHDLDAEREKVKGLHEITKVICTHCCEPMEIPSKAVLQTELTQLQALVRAAVERWRAQTNVKEGISFRMAMKALEATLDATTPASMDAAETHDRMFNHADRHPEAL